MKKDGQFEGRSGRFHFIDWGGNSQYAHFSHATGLCAAAYTPLARCLTGKLHMIGLDDRGHGKTDAPADPARLKGWNVFAGDLEPFLESWKAPFVAMGHSRGAVSSLLLACKRPDLVKALVLVDPTILPLAFTWYIYFLKKTGLIRHIPIASRAAKRQAEWPDMQTIRSVYRKKSMFRTWDPECFDGYLEDGTRGNGHGSLRLSCTPAWESRCFSVYPHNLWHFIPKIRQPTLVVYGGRSNTFRKNAVKRLRRQVPHAHFHCFRENGHFVPLEKPVATADVILDFVGSLDF
ncbi:MAG: alpha/beta hydrolase [Deltaproteobacteria bacterium]|nr:alpha/beta hydrolase [Deltaproteobacteria bacterium]